jgi:hypothetical protein
MVKAKTFQIEKVKQEAIEQQLAAMNTAAAEVTVAVAKYNDTMGSAWLDVEAAVASYNEARETLRTLLEAEAEDQQSQWDEMSEKWQEGERGEQVSEWIASIQEAADIDELELDRPDELDAGIDNDHELNLEYDGPA